MNFVAAVQHHFNIVSGFTNIKLVTSTPGDGKHLDLTWRQVLVVQITPGRRQGFRTDSRLKVVF